MIVTKCVFKFEEPCTRPIDRKISECFRSFFGNFRNVSDRFNVSGKIRIPSQSTTYLPNLLREKLGETESLQEFESVQLLNLDSSYTSVQSVESWKEIISQTWWKRYLETLSTKRDHQGTERDQGRGFRNIESGVQHSRLVLIIVFY